MQADEKSSHQSVRQKTYQQLKELILNGQVRPAEKLSEIRLAKRLGVSRTPLREALMKLEEEGLVIGERNVGYTVADLDFASMCDLLEVRKALDACAAELACARATDDDLARIRDVVRQMEELRGSAGLIPSNAARNLELGLRIHRVIAESTRNDPLIRMAEQVYQKLQLALWLEVLWVDFGDTDLAEHRAITDAICARDADAAMRAARAHVVSSLDNMSEVQEIIRHRRASWPL